MLVVVLATQGPASQELDKAARQGNVERVRALLQAGANPNELNQWGTTALTGASTMGANTARHTEIVRLLIRQGADVNRRVAGGTTALHEACFGAMRRQLLCCWKRAQM